MSGMAKPSDTVASHAGDAQKGDAARGTLSTESGELPAAKRDLLITSHTPTLGSGRALRTYGIARALATHRPLDLLYVRFGAEQPDAAFRSIPDVELHEVQPSRGFRRLLAYLGALAVYRVPHDLARGVSGELLRAASELAGERGRGRVVADGPTIAAALMSLANERPLIYNAHNLESGFRHELDGRARTRRLRERALRNFERRILSSFAECWMVSEADIEGARRLCPEARLRYVPNVIDVGAIPTGREMASLKSAAGSATQARAGGKRAIFVASFHYKPNRNALRFLLEEVMPLVWADEPDATLTVAGAGLPSHISDDARVRALGFVDDLDAVYAEAECALVPLLQGGGSPLKLIEALAHQLPVIATPRAVAGLQIRDGEHCLVADGAKTFARAVLEVMQGEAPREMAKQGRRLAQDRYSIEALARTLAP